MQCKCFDRASQPADASLHKLNKCFHMPLSLLEWHRPLAFYSWSELNVMRRCVLNKPSDGAKHCGTSAASAKTWEMTPDGGEVRSPVAEPEGDLSEVDITSQHNSTISQTPDSTINAGDRFPSSKYELAGRSGDVLPFLSTVCNSCESLV